MIFSMLLLKLQMRDIQFCNKSVVIYIFAQN